MQTLQNENAENISSSQFSMSPLLAVEPPPPPLHPLYLFSTAANLLCKSSRRASASLWVIHIFAIKDV